METRRGVLKYIAGTVGASVCSLDSLEAFAQNVATATSKPNIVCFVGEGLRWDELSSAGNKFVKTPNLDRIGHEGCTFQNAFVVNALCLPSRATFLTGMYSHTTGAVSNVEGKIPARFPLVSDLLQQAGYGLAQCAPEERMVIRNHQTYRFPHPFHPGLPFYSADRCQDITA